MSWRRFAAWGTDFGADPLRSTDTRFSGEFSPDGSVITGHWDRLPDESTWVDWMDITLTKQAT
jgi:hypothetical protein